jgi:hypothetical protein
MTDVLIAYSWNGRIDLAILRDVGQDWATREKRERGDFAFQKLEPGEADRMRLGDIRLLMEGEPVATLAQIVTNWRVAMKIAERLE